MPARPGGGGQVGSVEIPEIQEYSCRYDPSNRGRVAGCKVIKLQPDEYANPDAMALVAAINRDEVPG